MERQIVERHRLRFLRGHRCHGGAVGGWRGTASATWGRALVGVLEHEIDLEKRGPRGVSLGSQLLDQVDEGYLLTRPGVERPVARAAQEFRKRGVPGEVRPQHQQVGETADQALALGSVAVGDGGAQAAVGAARVARQQDLEDRKQAREQGGALATAEQVQGIGRARV